MADPLRFDGRVAPVTGGTDAIGRAVAEGFRAAGAEVLDDIDAVDGRLDVAVIHVGDAPDASDADGPAVIERHLLAPLQAAQAAHGVMQGQADGGAIVM